MSFSLGSFCLCCYMILSCISTFESMLPDLTSLSDIIFFFFYGHEYASFGVLLARWLANETSLAAGKKDECACVHVCSRVRARAYVCASVVWHEDDMWCSAIPPPPCKPQSSCYDSFLQDSTHMHTRTRTPVKFSSLRYCRLLHYLPHNSAVSVMLVMTKAC